jgi:hypothetical protein
MRYSGTVLRLAQPPLAAPFCCPVGAGRNRVIQNPTTSFYLFPTMLAEGAGVQ